MEKEETPPWFVALPCYLNPLPTSPLDAIRSEFEYAVVPTELATPKGKLEAFVWLAKEFPLHLGPLITLGGEAQTTLVTYPALASSMDTSELCVLYLSQFPRLSLEPDASPLSSTMSTLLGLRPPPSGFPKLETPLDPKNLIYLGLETLEPEEEFLLQEQGIRFYKGKTLQKIGLLPLLERILKDRKNMSFYLVLDFSFFSHKEFPAVHRRGNRGMEPETFAYLWALLEERVRGVDIVGFYRHPGSGAFVRSVKVYKQLVSQNEHKGEKKINLFNADSKIPICRSLEQKNEEDVGWYLLRGLKLDDRERCLKALEGDKIVSFDIDDETCLLSSTTLEKQQEKTYLSPSVKLLDRILFPQEKTFLLFELLNGTPIS
jgi:hypothetical protein